MVGCKCLESGTPITGILVDWRPLAGRCRYPRSSVRHPKMTPVKVSFKSRLSSFALLPKQGFDLFAITLHHLLRPTESMVAVTRGGRRTWTERHAKFLLCALCRSSHDAAAWAIDWGGRSAR
jgi:hypothetical protein